MYCVITGLEGKRAISRRLSISIAAILIKSNYKMNNTVTVTQ